MLPLYLLGNFHCAGMCGPLVMLLARHPYRWGYFFGRLFSFTAAGLAAAEMGTALFGFLARYHISAVFSLAFGLWIMLLSSTLLFQYRLPLSLWFAKRGAKIASLFSQLLQKKSFAAVFLFGAATLLLPCGQLVIVFSAIALNCSPLTGAVNGFAFALFTSPALIAAVHALRFFKSHQEKYRLFMGLSALLIGSLATLRGFADWGVIDHFGYEISCNPPIHLVLF